MKPTNSQKLMKLVDVTISSSIMQTEFSFTVSPITEMTGVSFLFRFRFLFLCFVFFFSLFHSVLAVVSFRIFQTQKSDVFPR